MSLAPELERLKTQQEAGGGAPRKNSALHARVPELGAPLPVHLDWIELALRLPAHVSRVKRWGASLSSPLLIELVDGRKVRFGELGDVNRPTVLVETVVNALRGQAPALPVFSKADSQDVLTVVTRACEAIEEEDEADQARDWADALSRVVSEVHHGRYTDQHERWAAMRWLDHEPDFDPSANRLAFQDTRYGIPSLVWADGEKWLRSRDVVSYVRGVLGERLDGSRITARLREAGWEHRRADAWRPGAGRTRTQEDRVRVSVLVAPGVESADAPPEAVSPAVPLTTTRVRTQAHAGQDWGHLGTPGGSSTDADDRAAGDTEAPGDTPDDWTAGLDEQGAQDPAEEWAA